MVLVLLDAKGDLHVEDASHAHAELVEQGVRVAPAVEYELEEGLGLEERAEGARLEGVGAHARDVDEVDGPVRRRHLREAKRAGAGERDALEVHRAGLAGGDERAHGVRALLRVVQEDHLGRVGGQRALGRRRGGGAPAPDVGTARASSWAPIAAVVVVVVVGAIVTTRRRRVRDGELGEVLGEILDVVEQNVEPTGHGSPPPRAQHSGEGDAKKTETLTSAGIE